MMKNVIKTSIIVGLLLAVTIGSAKDIPTLKNLNDGKTTMLTLLHVQQGNLLIIKDLSGKAFYEEIIRTSGKFRKEFHLTKLSDGAYYFELNQYLKVKKVPFEIIDNRVHYIKEKESITPKAIIRSTGSHLVVPRPSEIRKPTAQVIPRIVLSYKGRDFLNQHINHKKALKAKAKASN